MTPFHPSPRTPADGAVTPGSMPPPPVGVAPSVPPSSSSNLGRPSTAAKGFTLPAGGPPASYERAFRQFSSPSIISPPEEAAVGGPVTFQVYTAKDIGSGRGPTRSLAAIDMTRGEKKPSLGVRVGLAVVGALVVALTAAAVIAVSTEDPKTAPTTTATATPSAPITTRPAPTPSSVGDVIDDLPPTPTPLPAVAPVPAPVPTPIAAPKPRPRVAVPPPSMQRFAPPPNPYGK